MKLTVTGALHHMAVKSGRTREELSQDIGRNKTFLTAMVNRGTNPGLGLFVEIANACGYQVYLRGHGEDEEIVLKEEDND